MDLDYCCYGYNIDNIDGVVFRILHACDLHLTPILPMQNKKTFDLLSRAIDQTAPNLVVVNGDLVWTMYNKRMLRRFARFMEDKGVYWAYALGNHDVGFWRSKTKFTDVLNDYPHSMFLCGDENIGIGNYFVLLMRGDKPVFSLGFVDTSRKEITFQQRDWYVRTLKEIDELGNRKVNNITFMHVPLPVLNKLKLISYNGYITKRICSLGCDGGFFDAIKDNDNTIGVFNGHDHVNNFSGRVDNIFLMSAMASGYGAFNKHKLDRGYVCIDIDVEKGSFEARELFESNIKSHKKNYKK